MLRVVRDRILERGDELRRERVDLGPRGGLEDQHRDEFVAAEPRLGRVRRQDRADPVGRDLQHAVARGVAVDVVDGLEMIEVEQEERDLPLLRRGARSVPAPAPAARGD